MAAFIKINNNASKIIMLPEELNNRYKTNNFSFDLERNENMICKNINTPNGIRTNMNRLLCAILFENNSKSKPIKENKTIDNNRNR